MMLKNGIVGLMLLCAAIDAADKRPLITILNNTGYDISLQMGRPVVGSNVSGITYSYVTIAPGGEHELFDLVKTLGVRYAKNVYGYPNADAQYDNIDISGFDSHPGKRLIVTIGSSYGGYGAWTMDKKWEVSAAGGGNVHDDSRLKVITETDPYKILGVLPGTKQSDIKKAYYMLLKKNHSDKYPEGSNDWAIASKNTKLITEAWNKLFPNIPEQEK